MTGRGVLLIWTGFMLTADRAEGSPGSRLIDRLKVTEPSGAPDRGRPWNSHGAAGRLAAGAPSPGAASMDCEL
jgi:hypothetical protein